MTRIPTAQQVLAQQRADHEPGGFVHRTKALAAALPPLPEDYTMRKSDFWPAKYLKAEDILEPMVLTIQKVKRETFKNGGREETKPVVYFEESEKGVVLNMTNFDAIVDITDEGDTARWPASQVELFGSEVEVQGVMRPCIRIRRPGKPTTAKRKAPTSPSRAGGMDEPIPGEFAERRGYCSAKRLRSKGAALRYSLAGSGQSCRLPRMAVLPPLRIARKPKTGGAPTRISMSRLRPASRRACSCSTSTAIRVRPACESWKSCTVRYQKPSRQ
jgi:hypothetical protein